MEGVVCGWRDSCPISYPVADYVLAIVRTVILYISPVLSLIWEWSTLLVSSFSMTTLSPMNHSKYDYKYQA